MATAEAAEDVAPATIVNPDESDEDDEDELRGEDTVRPCQDPRGMGRSLAVRHPGVAFTHSGPSSASNSCTSASRVGPRACRELKFR